MELEEQTLTVRYSIYDREYELKNIPLYQIKFKIKPDGSPYGFPHNKLRLRYGEMVLEIHGIGDWDNDKIEEVCKIINKAAGEKHPYEFAPPYKHLPRDTKW